MRINSTQVKTTLAKVLAQLGFGGRAHLPAVDPRTQSWARTVGTYEEVPIIYRAFLDTLPANETSPFPYTVLTPTFKGIYSKPEHEKLVCAAGNYVHVLERIEDRFARTSYRLDGISYVESGVILLHAWITIHGFSDSGLVNSTTLVFNSVTEHVMAPLIQRMRAAQAHTTDAGLRNASPRLSCLQEVNFKFMSYAKRSIPAGDNVIAIAYQAEMRRELLRLPGLHLSRSISPAHVLILTDRELILLRDDDNQRWIQGSPNGAIWNYVPREKIESASLGIKDNRLLLSVDLAGNVHIESLFESSKKDELESLLQHLNCHAPKSGLHGPP